MKTTIALLACWVVAIAAWVGFVEIASDENWRLAGLATAALYLGAPLVIVIPLIHLPVLKWLKRRSPDNTARRLVMVAASGVLAVPVAIWPVLIVSGDPGDVVSQSGQQFILLYAVFGLAFGAWYAAFSGRNRGVT